MAENGNDLALGYMMGNSDSGGSNNGGWGMDGGWGGLIGLLIVASLFGGRGGLFGGGMFGGGSLFGGGGGAAELSGIATRADISNGFALNNITSGITAIQQGIADSTYALNNSITNGFHGVDSAICNLGYQQQSGMSALSTQLAQCCCDNRAAIADLKYTIATEDCATRNLMQNNTRDLMDNQNANTRAILDFLTQDKIATLTAENQSLKFAASQANQNAFITANQEAQTAELIRRLGRDCPVPAYIVPNPNCCYPQPQNNDCRCGGF